MEVGLDPRHIVLDGEPAPPKRHSLQFSAHVCCGQTSGWIKIPLGRQDSVTDPKARLTETAHGELDGCIVWNAHNTVQYSATKRLILIYIVPVCYVKTGRYGKTKDHSNIIISIHRKFFSIITNIPLIIS